MFQKKKSASLFGTEDTLSAWTLHSFCYKYKYPSPPANIIIHILGRTAKLKIKTSTFSLCE